MKIADQEKSVMEGPVPVHLDSSILRLAAKTSMNAKMIFVTELPVVPTVLGHSNVFAQLEKWVTPM
jgi:hypothetical protein